MVSSNKETTASKKGMRGRYFILVRNFSKMYNSSRKMYNDYEYSFTVQGLLFDDTIRRRANRKWADCRSVGTIGTLDVMVLEEKEKKYCLGC